MEITDEVRTRLRQEILESLLEYGVYTRKKNLSTTYRINAARYHAYRILHRVFGLTKEETTDWNSIRESIFHKEII